MENQNIINIDAEIRTSLGTKTSKHLRKEGKIPAVIYGGAFKDKIDHISLDAKAFNIMFLNKDLISKIFAIKLSDGTVENAFIKDFQIDHVNQRILHIDFIRISENLLVKAKIPINYINKQKSAAIKQGAFLNVSKYFVYIKCKGDNIPTSFTIDLEGTEPADRFYIENLDLPEGAEIINKKELLCNFASKRGKAIKA